MRHNRQLFIEIVDETLRRLGTKKEGVDCYELWNAIPNLRRAKRVPDPQIVILVGRRRTIRRAMYRGALRAAR